MAEYNKYTTYEPETVHSLHVVSFHTGDPFSNTQSEARFSHYTITAIPSNVYDGGNQRDYSFNEAKLNTSGVRSIHKLKMDLSKSVSGSTLWFKGKVSNLESAGFNGFVLVFIVENGLVDPNYPTVTWNFVFRDYCLNKTLRLAGSSTDFSNGSWILPSGVIASNIQVVAAVYDADARDPVHGWPYTVQSVCDVCGRATDDVGITTLTTAKTLVGQGLSLNLSSQVANYGAHAETFSIVAYANTAVIQTQTIAVQNGSCSNVTFTWSTTGFAKGTYTISAYAWPVPGETDTTDNTCIDGFVKVTIPGDVDGNSRVDMSDVVFLLDGFGSKPGKPNWDPDLDVDNSGLVDMGDIVIALDHFGQHCP